VLLGHAVQLLYQPSVGADQLTEQVWNMVPQLGAALWSSPALDVSSEIG
jgi:hypothetical protein